MSRARHVVFAALALAAGPFVVGCGQDEGQFVILQNQVPQAGCVIPGELSKSYRGAGVLDVGLVRDGASAGYLLFPLLQNNYPKRSTGADPNRLRLKGAHVSVRAVDVPDAVTAMLDQLAASADGQRFLDYDEPWSGTVDSGGGTLPMGLDAFPAELARRIRALGVLQKQTRLRFMLGVRAIADGPDGTLKSDEFDYPLDLCEGCLVTSAPACPAMPTAMGNACNVAQDDAVDCCVAGTALACPAVAH
jgi:hypothetical protein